MTEITQFIDLGLIISANLRINQADSTVVEVGGGPFVIHDGFFQVYIMDYMNDGTTTCLSVARARVDDVLYAAIKGQSVVWKKYHEGAFSEPALGGKSSSIVTERTGCSWMDVSYNEFVSKYILISYDAFHNNLYLEYSNDGINWKERQQLTEGPGEKIYPTIIGTGDNPNITGEEFYVYHILSRLGGVDRWKDAKLVRRKITLLSTGEDIAAITSDEEIIYDKKERYKTCGKWWPDGIMGSLKYPDGVYRFYAANGEKPVLNVGTLEKPGKEGSLKVNIMNKKGKHDYLAGGRVYLDPKSKRILMFYHSEVYKGGNNKKFYSAIGLAISEKALQ